MVQVRDAYPLDDQGNVDIQQWVTRLDFSLADEDQETMRAALARAAEFIAPFDNDEEEGIKIWGEEYSRFLTGLEMAEILVDLNLDRETLVAAVLYRTVRDELVSLADVKVHFGDNAARLIDGVLKMAAISRSDAVLSNQKILGQNQAQPDHMRKMLVAMVDDVRVALIKLSERTCAIRAVKNNEQRRHKVAKEVFEIYAPLAHRLGIGHIKWELEDLSFRYLEPDAYKRIAKQLDERRIDRQQFIVDVKNRLEQELVDASIEGEVFGRAKHIYSIWRKMQRKRIDFSQVYDIRAMRILVKEPRDCYTVLGIIHTLWKAIPNEFDDYIALPKENGYRSLHTAVIGPDAKVLEIQIRTYGMHEEAEFGVCAHWAYKGADKAKGTTGYEEKIAWLKQVLDEHDDGSRMEDFADELSTDVTQDQIYVFTPDGHVVELSNGATPLDFAYRVHTEVGHRCRGAKVNGRIVPLTYALQTGQQVEILTAKDAEPSREWLRPTLGYLKTSRSRAKVRYWFKQRDKAQNIITGRVLLEREFKRLSLTSLDFKQVANQINFDSVEDMYAAVGAGDIGTGLVLKSAQSIAETEDTSQYELSTSWRVASESTKVGDDVQVYGAGNMMTQMANCCKPLPGDIIAGYVTVGRGVTVHRQDCSQFMHLQEQEPERIIEVNWGKEPEQTYPVDIHLEAYDRSGLLRDITTLLANERVNVIAVQTVSNQAHSTADMRLTVEVKGIEWLSRLLAKLSQLPNVIDVQRVLDK